MRDRDTARMRVVKTKSGWAVSQGQPYYLQEMPTKHEAEEWIDWALATQAALRQAKADTEARLTTFLASRGIGPVDYRDLQPGDLFTWGPFAPIRTVTKVDHLTSGAALVFWQPVTEPRSEAFTLMTPGGPPAYGHLSHPPARPARPAIPPRRDNG